MSLSGITLSVTDNADGTGASIQVVTTAGQGLTFTVTKQACTADGTQGPVINVYSNPNTVLGTYNVSPGVGNSLAGTGDFLWQVSNANGSTDRFFQAITSEGDSVWYRCMVMIKDRITAIGFGSTLLPGGVLIRSLAKQAILNTGRVIIVSCTGLSEEKSGGPLGQDDVVYPVMVEVAEKMQNESESHLQAWLMMRHKIDRALDNVPRFDQRVPEVWLTEVDPAPIIDPEMLEDQMVRVSLLTVKCKARENRGLTF